MRIVFTFIRLELAMFIILLFFVSLSIGMFGYFFYKFVYLGASFLDSSGALLFALMFLGAFVFCFDFAHEYYKKIIFVSKELNTDIESIAILSSDTLQRLYDECVEHKTKQWLETHEDKQC